MSLEKLCICHTPYNSLHPLSIQLLLSSIKCNTLYLVVRSLAGLSVSISVFFLFPLKPFFWNIYSESGVSFRKRGLIWFVFILLLMFCNCVIKLSRFRKKLNWVFPLVCVRGDLWGPTQLITFIVWLFIVSISFRVNCLVIIIYMVKFT